MIVYLYAQCFRKPNQAESSLSHIFSLRWVSCSQQLISYISPIFSPITSSLALSGAVPKSKRNCDEIGKLLNNRQVQVCKRNIDFMESVRTGATIALQECQFQFLHRRWNCTTVQFEKSPVFGNSLNGGKTNMNLVIQVLRFPSLS